MNIKHMFQMFGSLLALNACAGDPEASLSFFVRDDYGNVISNAPVAVSTFKRWVPGNSFGRDEYSRFNGMTDTNGEITLQFPSKTGHAKYSVYVPPNSGLPHTMMAVAGKTYYRDGGGEIRLTNISDNCWQPWNSRVEIELKEVIKPIPMFAKRLHGIEFPSLQGSMSYDLENGDWLPPYGKGKTADFIFNLICKFGDQIPGNIYSYDATLTLSFSNDGDGIQEYIESPNLGSHFHMLRYAPETGYTNQWFLHKYENRHGSSASTIRKNEEMNHYFRIRTVTDNKGDVLSARYGKIRGPIWFGVSSGKANLTMQYYLNPTPNDRNMEFNPSQNMIKNLTSLEQVLNP